MFPLKSGIGILSYFLEEIQNKVWIRMIFEKQYLWF